MKSLEELGIKFIAGGIREFISQAPDGFVGFTDTRNIDELKGCIERAVCFVALVSASDNKNVLRGTKNTCDVARINLDVAVNNPSHPIYVIDNSKGDIDVWACDKAYGIARNARVVYILDDTGETA